MFAERFLHDVGLHGSSFPLTQVGERMRQVLVRIRQGGCAIRGHDLRLHREPRRLSLRCADCGWQSSGWSLGHGAPVARLDSPAGAARRGAHADAWSRERRRWLR
jgi:hypothetical protein